MTMRRRSLKLISPKSGALFWSLLARVTLLFLGFLTSIILARLFGPEPLAQMSLLVSLLVVTSHLSLFGSQMTILRRLPVQTDPAASAETIGTAGIFTLLLGLLIGGGMTGLIMSGWLDIYTSQLGSGFMVLLPLIVLLNALRILGLETLRALRRISVYNTVAVLNAFLLLFIVLAVWMIGYDTIQVAWVILATELLSLMLISFLVFSGSGLTVRIPSSIMHISSHIRVSSIFFLSSSSVLVGQIDLLVAGGIVSLDHLGFYAVAIRIASLAGLVLISSNIAFAPEVSNVFHSKGLGPALTLAMGQTRLLVPLTLAISAAIAIVGYPLLLLFGPSFVAAYPALLIILLGHISSVLFGPVGTFLNMTIGHREMVLVTVLELVVAFFVSIFLIPTFGITGAAMANAAAQITRAVLATALLYMRAGTAITIFHAYRR